MAPLAGFIQLLLALILAIVGMWSAIFVAPWAFFGDRPDYAFVAIVCSPLLLSAILFGSAYLTLSSSPGSTRTRESGTRPGNDSTRLHDAPRSDEHGP